MSSQEDCILGVGITGNEIIINVFQLNERQAEQMINLGAELKYRNELLNNQAENIMKHHPQSSPKDLIALAEEYKIIRDSMERAQRIIDEKVLAMFNEKQYERYLSLCNEAFREPIRIIPVSYRDSLDPK